MKHRLRAAIETQIYYLLHSLNPDYDDIFPYEGDAKIIGKVLGVVTTDMILTNPQRNLFIETLETLSDGD